VLNLVFDSERGTTFKAVEISHNGEIKNNENGGIWYTLGWTWKTLGYLDGECSWKEAT
jgi:hypothetical protein